MIQASILYHIPSPSLSMCVMYAFVPACLYIYVLFIWNQEKVAEISIKNMFKQSLLSKCRTTQG